MNVQTFITHTYSFKLVIMTFIAVLVETSNDISIVSCS